MKKTLTFIFLSILIGVSYGQLSNGLIAKYYFNSGNANDDNGRYHGIVNGATLTTDRFGNANSAYQFAINQNITVKDTDALDGMSAGMSISFWVQAPIVSNYNGLISKFSHCGGGADAYNIYITQSNTIMSQIDDASGYDSYQNGKKTLSTNKWHHVVVIWSRPNVSIYIDTIKDSFSRNDIFNSIISNSDEVLAFGHPKTILCPYTYDYNEKLDDIRIYNRALSKLEVDSLFSEKNPCSPTFSKFTVEACNSYIWKSKGNKSYSMNNTTDTIVLKNKAGCDSIVTLNLTIKSSSITNLNQTIKTGHSYAFNGKNITSPGVYRDTLQNKFGCDSIIVLNLSNSSDVKNSDFQFAIYPNPSNGFIQIIGLKEQTLVTIYNSEGEEIKHVQAIDSFNLSDLPNGNYQVKINNQYIRFTVSK